MQENEIIIKAKKFIESIEYDRKYIYLLDIVSETAGFFLHNDKLTFIRKNINGKNDYVKAVNVSVQLNVPINSERLNSQFPSGNYDIIYFNGKVENNCQITSSFLRLCRIFNNLSDDVDFLSFFYDLISLLELPKETKFKNMIGLFGELVFIKYIYEKFSLDITGAWHIVGNYDKYDFVFSNINVEVKTTLNNQKIVSLKHSQVFNNMKNCIAVVTLEEDPSGIKISNLIEYFQTTKPFAKNFELQLKIEKERLRLISTGFDDDIFSMNSISFYLNTDLVTLSSIPNVISNIEYKYNFANQKELLDECLLSLMKE